MKSMFMTRERLLREKVSAIETSLPWAPRSRNLEGIYRYVFSCGQPCVFLGSLNGSGVDSLSKYNIIKKRHSMYRWLEDYSRE